MLQYFPQKSATLRTFAASVNTGGEWASGAATDTTISIIEPQPAMGSELTWMPEADRKREHYFTWTQSTVDIHGESEGRDADQLIYDGDTFTVVRAENWRAGPFKELVLRRVPEGV